MSRTYQTKKKKIGGAPGVALATLCAPTLRRRWSPPSGCRDGTPPVLLEPLRQGEGWRSRSVALAHPHGPFSTSFSICSKAPPTDSGTLRCSPRSSALSFPASTQREPRMRCAARREDASRESCYACTCAKANGSSDHREVAVGKLCGHDTSIAGVSVKDALSVTSAGTVLGIDLEIVGRALLALV